jgi:hypothetical protein
MPAVDKSDFKSHQYWKKHCDQVRRARDIAVFTYLNKHPMALKVKEYPEADKKILQMMHLSKLRTFILETGIDPSLAESKYGLAQTYTISEIVAI